MVGGGKGGRMSKELVGFLLALLLAFGFVVAEEAPESDGSPVGLPTADVGVLIEPSG